jgi:hypothetical protein
MAVQHECETMKATAPRKTGLFNLFDGQSFKEDEWRLDFPTHDDDPSQSLIVFHCPYCGQVLPSCRFDPELCRVQHPNAPEVRCTLKRHLGVEGAAHGWDHESVDRYGSVARWSEPR